MAEKITNITSKIVGPLDFLRQVRVELSKVVWPTRAQTVKLTFIVIVVTILVGFFILGIDFLLQQGLKLISDLKK